MPRKNLDINSKEHKISPSFRPRAETATGARINVTARMPSGNIPITDAIITSLLFISPLLYMSARIDIATTLFAKKAAIATPLLRFANDANVIVLFVTFSN